MKFLCVFVCISVAALALADESEEGGKIVGGHLAKPNELPYQLSLRSGGSHICGASYIGNKRAVTAAHCTDGATASQLSVQGGWLIVTILINIGGQVITVAKIIQHPNYNSDTIDYDISLLILEADFTDPFVSPIPLCSAPVPVGAIAQISGWGTIKEGVPLTSLFLKVADVPIVDKATCKAAYGQDAITEQMICAGFPQGGTDTCQGDSGGPLAYNKELCGITSWGEGCAQPGKPGVYTDVTKFIEFINQPSP